MTSAVGLPERERGARHPQSPVLAAWIEEADMMSFDGQEKSVVKCKLNKFQLGLSDGSIDVANNRITPLPNPPSFTAYERA